ncbi:hypothetical protein [Natroniella sp. ANB-PHB2]|uniref:hypothetical protein n=1 Tax=Natroniella sp. ANB-PHB2 TaxID=3384444 RepID=UPI0038D4B66C
MARVGPGEVLEIAEFKMDENKLDAFIKTANIQVNKHLIDKGLSEEELEEIEKWLAAHFASVAAPRVKEKRIMENQYKYEGPMMDKGLDGSMYGQTAKVLDHTGILAKLGAKKGMFTAL